MEAILLKQDLYTYADYLTWDDDERCEIINGILYNMSPAPRMKHQEILLGIAVQLVSHLKTSKSHCKTYIAPFDVIFPESVRDYNKIIDVVQPDIAVICNVSLLDEKCCHGAPDYIIEILSPSTAQKDYGVKRTLYEKNSVQEYWLIDPENHIVTVYRLEEPGRYGKPLIHADKGELEVKTLKGLAINLDSIFSESP